MGGVTHLLLALVIWSLSTHLFRDGTAQLVLVVPSCGLYEGGGENAILITMHGRRLKTVSPRTPSRGGYPLRARP